MQPIEISHVIPPVYERLNLRFGADWEKGVIIAYNGKIHQKSKVVQPQKVIHEKVHLDEQKRIGNDAWWELYLTDDAFRLEQETMAYKTEANFIKKHIKQREHRFQMIRELAHAFSSSLYGGIITPEQALKLLM